MRKKIVFTICYLLVIFILAPTAQADLTARQIMEKVDARDDGDRSIAQQTMILIDKNDNQRVRKMKAVSIDQGKDVWRLMFFLSPADVKDTGFLTYDYYSGEKDDDQWLYLPALKKVKRIASSDKSSAFMGSDFSYSDMTRRVLDEWKYTLLKEMDVRGSKCWLIQAEPVSKAVEDRYGYTKSVVFIRQDLFMAVRGVHWVKEGRKLKYFDVPEIKQIDGVWTAMELHMKTTKNKQTLHRTVIRFDDIRYNQDVDKNLFNTRTLEKGF